MQLPRGHGDEADHDEVHHGGNPKLPDYLGPLAGDTADDLGPIR